MTIKRYPKVHLNFPVERKYADHNGGKKMLITICLFSHKKCANIRNVPFEVFGTMWWRWVETSMVGSFGFSPPRIIYLHCTI